MTTKQILELKLFCEFNIAKISSILYNKSDVLVKLDSPEFKITALRQKISIIKNYLLNLQITSDEELLNGDVVFVSGIDWKANKFDFGDFNDHFYVVNVDETKVIQKNIYLNSKYRTKLKLLKLEIFHITVGFCSNYQVH